MTGSRDGFTVRVQRIGSTAPAGVGFVVDDTHIITCAHVVNTALDRDPRAQDIPDPDVRVQVDFPMLGGATGAPSRSCAVQAWVPPPLSGVSGGDIAGLAVIGERLPGRASPARLADPPPTQNVAAVIFGYPGDPPRRASGAWSGLRLQSAVGGGLIQLDTGGDSAIRAQAGYSGSPVIVTGDTGDVVLGMLAVASSNDRARDAYAIPVSELARAWPDVVGRLTIPICPYRGLRAFTTDDADVFVGREDEVGSLAEMVRMQPLVVVTGPSGVGKSSLVNAGLIPLMLSEGWAAGMFRPGGMPVEALARALAAVQASGRPPTVQEVGEWAALIRSKGLTNLGSRLALALGQPVVLHADQLEEILDPEACSPNRTAEFLELLLAAQASPDDGLHLVGTLRADFLAQLLEHPDAGMRLREGWFGLSPMSRNRLEEVIAKPARAKGVDYQDGLVRVIAEDAGGGGLPLLEFTLKELWPNQQGRQITWAAYQAIGGVTGALSHYAEQAYQDLLAQFPQEQIRRVMLALVSSRGGAMQATRRVVTRQRLGKDWKVAQALAKRRLLILNSDEGTRKGTAEIAHEALIREWPTLASWVNDDADFQHWLASAEERAAEGDLLPDTRLAEAERWLAERSGDVPCEVKNLIQDSKSDWLRRVTELKNARDRAEARRLAAAAELALIWRETSLQVPIALAVESLRLAPVLEADIAVRHAMRTAAQQISRLDHDGEVTAVAFSPDGTKVATGSSDHSARVFDAATGAEISRLDHDGNVTAVALSPDGTKVATSSGHYGERVFDAATGAEISRLDHDGGVSAVALSPDGTKVATSSGHYGERVFDVATGAEVSRLTTYPVSFLIDDSIVNVVAFSPDGTQVATGSSSSSYGGPGYVGDARVFDATTGIQTLHLAYDGEVTAVAFSPDGTRLATVSNGFSARVFDVATGAEISRLDHDGEVTAVTFSPDGTRMATGSGNSLGNGCARVFDVATGAEISRLDHDGEVTAVTFSPDGTRMATGSGNSLGNGCARVFDVATGAEISRLDHDGEVTAVVFSPDGTRVATGSKDHSARLFDMGIGAEISRLDHDNDVSAVVFSPDGTRVATGSKDHSARLFDAATGAEISRLDHDGEVTAVAFSPDGTRVATGSEDHRVSGSARVFDAETGAEISRLDGGAVNAVAFSPDGTRVAVGSNDELIPDQSYTEYTIEGSARVFYAATGAVTFRLDGGAVNAVAFSPDGTRVAAGGSASWTRCGCWVFDAATGAEISRLDHDGEVTAVAFSPDGTGVATGSKDHSARVFDAATGAEISRLDHDNDVSAVAFSPDGTRVATGSGNPLGRSGCARVFDAATGTEISRLDHKQIVTAVAFSPDGARVATGSKDHSARVFDAATGAEISRLDHDGNVNAVAFSPDGTRVATGSSDRIARVSCADRGQLIEQALGRLTRNLTQQEWERHFRDEPYRKTRADLP